MPTIVILGFTGYSQECKAEAVYVGNNGDEAAKAAAFRPVAGGPCFLPFPFLTGGGKCGSVGPSSSESESVAGTTSDRVGSRDPEPDSFVRHGGRHCSGSHLGLP